VLHNKPTTIAMSSIYGFRNS